MGRLWRKRLGVCIVVVGLPQTVAIGHVARPAGLAAELETVDRFPGHTGTAELSAWVLETDNPQTPVIPASFYTFFRARPGLARSVANRNRNPLNIKLGSDTRRYVERGVAMVSDIIPADGGRFLRFVSPETGFRAAIELLNTRPYGVLQVDQVLRRWSNSGYGAEILAGTSLDPRMPTPRLGRDDLRILLRVMAAAEGYKSSTIADEIQNAILVTSIRERTRGAGSSFQP